MPLVRALLLFWLLLVAVVLHAQTAFTHERLSAATGLRYDSDNVFVFTDSRSFTWIGSEAGPYRYDGHHIDHYGRSTDGSRPQVVSNFYEAADSTIWFSTLGGIAQYRYEDDLIKTVKFGQPTNENEPAPIAPMLFRYAAKPELLWQANGREAFAVSVSEPTRVLARTPSQAVRHLAIGREEGADLVLGFPWLLAPGLERLSFTDDGEVRVTTSRDKRLSKATFREGAVDHLGGVWLCGSDGLYEYDSRRDSLLGVYRLPGKSAMPLFDVVSYDTLLILAIDGDGAWWFDPQRKVFLEQVDHVHSIQNVPVTDRPLALATNALRELYVTRGDGGIDRLLPRRFDLQYALDGQGERIRATTIAEDDQGNIHVGTEDGRLISYNSEAKLIHERRSGDSSGQPAVSLTASTVRGETYGYLRDTLYRYDADSSWVMLSYAYPGIKKLIGGGDVVIAITDTQLIKTTVNEISLLPVPHGINRLGKSINRADEHHLFIDKFDSWVRLSSIDDDNIIQADSFSVSTEILNCVLDSSSRIAYIGCLHGVLSYYQSDSSNWVFLDTVVKGSRPNSLLNGPNHSLWIATGNGLYTRRAYGWELVRAHDGLPAIQQRGCLYSSDGINLWMELKSGLAFVQFAKKPTDRLGHLYLRAIELDGQVLPGSEGLQQREIQFQGQVSQLRFQVGSVGRSAHGKTSFLYRLTGIEDEWTALNSNDVVLSKIPPGRYMLELLGLAADGQRLPTLKIKIRSVQPYWQTWWFFLSIALATLALGSLISYIIYRQKLLRTRRKYEQQLAIAQERERIARDLHDDLGADLATILYISDTDGEPLSAAEQEEITSLSQGALAHMRGIVNRLDGDRTPVLRLWRELKEATKASCLRYGVKCATPTPSLRSTTELSVSAEARKEITLFTKEAVSNALKHATPKVLTLLLAVEGEHTATLTITDDGEGFDLGERSTGMGLESLYARASNLGGELNILSDEGHGTQVRLRWPL